MAKETIDTATMGEPTCFSPCVLVIDDDATFRADVIRMLRSEDCQVLQARDEVEGRRFLDVLTPDVIVTSPGFRLIDALHAESRLAGVTLLFSSAPKLSAVRLRRAVSERRRLHQLLARSLR